MADDEFQWWELIEKFPHDFSTMMVFADWLRSRDQDDNGYRFEPHPSYPNETPATKMPPLSDIDVAECLEWCARRKKRPWQKNGQWLWRWHWGRHYGDEPTQELPMVLRTVVARGQFEPVLTTAKDCFCFVALGLRNLRQIVKIPT